MPSPRRAAALRGDGDRVFARVAFQGTHQGVFLSVSPTGRQIVFEAMEEYRVVGGRFAEKWMALDKLSLMQQLGVIPSPAIR